VDDLDLSWELFPKDAVDELIDFAFDALGSLGLVLHGLFLDLPLVDLVEVLAIVEEHADLRDLEGREPEIVEDLVLVQVLQSRVTSYELSVLLVQLVDQLHCVQLFQRAHFDLLRESAQAVFVQRNPGIVHQWIVVQVGNQHELEVVGGEHAQLKELPEVVQVFLDDLAAVIDEQHDLQVLDHVDQFILVHEDQVHLLTDGPE